LTPRQPKSRGIAPIIHERRLRVWKGAATLSRDGRKRRDINGSRYAPMTAYLMPCLRKTAMASSNNRAD
jgi:hypothetical protein